MDLNILTAPLTTENIEWRVQNQTKDGQKLTVVPYITNRCVMQRFDEQFGWAGWENQITEIEGGFICTITVVMPDGNRVSKSDGASRSAVEPVKGGISDAMKRCAVQFGMGRELYTFPKVLLQTTDKFIPDWGFKQLDILVQAHIDGTYDGRSMVMISSQTQLNYGKPVAKSTTTTPAEPATKKPTKKEVADQMKAQQQAATAPAAMPEDKPDFTFDVEDQWKAYITDSVNSIESATDTLTEIVNRASLPDESFNNLFNFLTKHVWNNYGILYRQLPDSGLWEFYTDNTK